LRKAQVAHLTLEGFQFLMNLFDVPLQNPVKLKRLWTLAASKKLFIFVHSIHVFLQSRLATKVFLANFTCVRFQLVVDSIYVSLKHCFTFKCFIANMARDISNFEVNYLGVPLQFRACFK
jgi:hypothetical protein